MGAWTESDSSGVEEDKENAVPRWTKKLKLDTSAERWHFINEELEEVLGKKYMCLRTPPRPRSGHLVTSVVGESRNKRFSTVYRTPFSGRPA